MASTLFDEYYKLKDAYENSIKAQRFDILKQKKKKNKTNNVNEQDIRKKLMKLKPKCINCQKEGGCLFSSAFDEKELSRVLSAKCGAVTNPCSLNIKIVAGSHELVQDILKHDEQELENIKQQIIDDKNKLLFGYMKSEEVIEKFDQLKKQINEYSSSIEYYTKIFYDKVDNKADKEELNKLIANSYQSIQIIKDYLNGDDYEDQHIVSAVKVYMEQLKPQLDKIMKLKYKESVVWYDEDTMTYHLMQSYQTIGSLEVALVETKVKSKSGERKNEEYNENKDEEPDSGEESGISIGEEIEDESYESLD
jgi:hypothetical protein